MDCPALLRLAEAVDRGLLHHVGVHSTALPDGKYRVGHNAKGPICVNASRSIEERSTEGYGNTVAEAAEACEALVAKQVEATADRLAAENETARRLRNLLS